MSDLRFDGRVAIITGAGRGIGRAYARLLGERGAEVVVNDLGTAMDGAGNDEAPAEQVASQIGEAGGSAVADCSDVASPEGARALVDAALDAFGRVDIVINNAGIIDWAGMPEVDADNLARHISVHVAGSFNTTKAAWSTMADRRYGRVVMTTSAGMFGLANNTSYATAKGGVVGLARSLAVAGRDHDIKVNLIAPAAMTRMAGRPGAPEPDDGAAEAAQMSPDLVAPMVAYLAHDQCPVSGEIYAAGAGRFSRIFLATTLGFTDVETTPTIEDVAANWAAINDESDYYVPSDLMDWSATFIPR